MSKTTTYEQSMDLEALYYLSLPDRPTLYGLADHLGVVYLTMHKWRRLHPTFNTAVKKGLDVRSKNIGNVTKKYNKALCNKVLKLCAEGKSKGSVCLALGITYDTLRKWQDDHADFKLAVETGKLLAQEHYEQLGYEAMLGKIKDFDSKIWTTTMKNRFDYSEKTEVSGNPDKPLHTGIVLTFVDNEADNDEESPQDDK